METKEVLEAARSLLALGWCQKTSRQRAIPADRYCAVGAVLEAAKDSQGLDTTSYLSAIQALRAHAPCAITLWNDEEDRTQDEVLALFDAAIASFNP